MKTSLRIITATALFAGLHSVLASRSAKRLFAHSLGHRNRNGLYRIFYVGQSVASFAALASYIRQQPGSVVYEIRGPLKVPLRGAQLTCLAIAAVAAHQVGIIRITGVESFLEWRQSTSVHPEPEAQGPALFDSTLHITGPFRWSRHPLNFWPLPVFWLNPRMTTNLLAFNVAATIYLVIGSSHEESRLRKAYGEQYETYQLSDVPFYFPRGVRTNA